MEIMRREDNYVLFKQGDTIFVGLYKKFDKNNEEIWCQKKYFTPKSLNNISKVTFIEKVKAFLMEEEE